MSIELTTPSGAWNEDPKPSVWQNTAEQILERLASYRATINEIAD